MALLNKAELGLKYLKVGHDLANGCVNHVISGAVFSVLIISVGRGRAIKLDHNNKFMIFRKDYF